MPPAQKKWRQLGPLWRGRQYDGTNGPAIVNGANTLWPGQEIVRMVDVEGVPTLEFNDPATWSWQLAPTGMHFLIRIGADGGKQYAFKMPADLIEDFAEEP